MLLMLLLLAAATVISASTAAAAGIAAPPPAPSIAAGFSCVFRVKALWSLVTTAERRQIFPINDNPSDSAVTRNISISHSLNV